MYAAIRKQGEGGLHVDVTVERGYRTGTWEVFYDAAAAAWRVRDPRRRELVLASDAWIGELGSEMDELMCRIARRAVGEALRNEGADGPGTGRERLPAGSQAA